MLVCAVILRLSLASALGDRRALLARPVALAPEPGGPQVIGETSGAAEAFGVRAGMRIGEALSRCPRLGLVAPDPVRAEAAWELSLRRLESIGAAVEPSLPGEAFFATEPLRALHGGPDAILRRARQALSPAAGARVGAGPNRLSARAAAIRMRARRPPFAVSDLAAGRLLAGLQIHALHQVLHCPAASGGAGRAGEAIREAACIDALERLGIGTLGELAALPAEAIADRFGELGLRAHPARAGRTIRRLRIEAALAGGAGGWRSEATLRSASSSSKRLLLVLAPRLAELPGPAAWLGLRALELGPEAGEQETLARSPAAQRRKRLAEAVRQVRSAAGRDAVLRVLEVDPGSRVPERRAVLAPWNDHRG